MAEILTPTIKTILKVTEYDLLRIKVSMGYMYMCTDTMKLYYDQGNSINDRVIYNYISIRTVNDLHNKVNPIYGYTYYCWEDNSLWVWLNKWECLYSDTTYPSAYAYEEIPSTTNPSNLNPIYRYDMPNMPADDNGLLKDGSVVVRDRNRLIKGKIYINDDNDNLVISSYLGGGIRLLPNGRMSTEGELLLSDVGESFIRGSFRTINDELYVDYTDDPNLDNNTFKNSTHKYKVFHEGNLDTSAIIIMQPEQVYNKLLDSSLPDVLEFNVRQLDGHMYSDFAPSSHTHLASSITDLTNVVEDKCGVSIRKVFNSMSSTGISSSYNPVTNHLTLRVNDFSLTFNGGVEGTAIVHNLENTTISLAVNPDEHIHQDLIDEIDRLKSICEDLQRQIDELK